MTPFAALGQAMEKRAFSGQAFPHGQQGYTSPYGPGGHNYLADPPQQPAQQPQAQPDGKGGWTWGDTGMLALDIAAASNPITGVPYYGVKAFNDFKDGNVWSGISNIGWGASSFLPGAASIGKGIFSGISRGAAKMTPGVIKSMQTGAKLSPKAMKTIGTGSMVAGIGGMGASMLTGENAPAGPQQAPQQPPPGDLIDNMAGTMMNQ